MAPPTRRPVREMLDTARGRLARLTAAEAHRAVTGGAVLIDVRTSEQRTEHGQLPAAVAISLNVLEWRLDPAEPVTLPWAGDFDRQVIVICQEGYCSSLAAARLQDLGYQRATDVVGGFEAWREAGLPITTR